MIRGAVAFGLVLRIEPDVEHRSVIVTTSLALVCWTTIVLGSTVATVQRCLFGKAEHKKEEIEEGEHDPNTSHHDQVLHPNLSDEKVDVKNVDQILAGGYSPDVPQKKIGCLTILKRMDVHVIKPLLIYKYESGVHKKQKEFIDLFLK